MTTLAGLSIAIALTGGAWQVQSGLAAGSVFPDVQVVAVAGPDRGKQISVLMPLGRSPSVGVFVSDSPRKAGEGPGSGAA